MTRKILIPLCVLLLWIMLVFSACSKPDKLNNTDIATDFTADFSADYKQMKIGGSINSNSGKLYDISIISPETISGLKVSYRKNELILTRDKIICTADEAYIPDCSFTGIVKDIISGISDGRAVLASKSDNMLTYNLKTSLGNAVITTDDKGCIKTAELKDEQLNIRFYNTVTSCGVH